MVKMEALKLLAKNSVLLLLLASILVAVNGAPINSKTYIIHMEKNMSHTDVMAKGAWYSELMQGAKMLLSHDEADDGMDCLHHVYDKVFNGFSARLTPEQASYMENLPGVLALYPNRIHTAQTTRSATFLGLTDSNATLWNETNYGEGMIIGVIDTGIWPERLSFSDYLIGPVPAKWKGICETGVGFNASKCNNKIIGARYFVRGNEREFGPINATNEYKSPRDWNGHGTHCASTAAGRRTYRASAYGLAKGTVTGMAPKARIAVYKALWRSEGQGVTDDIVAAIDQAVADGVDVISFSVSGFGGVEFYSDPFAIAAYNAMQLGIFFSAAGGNVGPADYTINNIAPWVTTVAATTQDRDIDASVELGDGSILSGRSTFDGKGPGQNNKLPLIYAGDAANDGSVLWNASVCQQADLLNASLVQGKIVLCDSASETNYYDIVYGAGAAGIILANTPSMGEALRLAPPFPAPFTHVGNEARKSIMAYIRATSSAAVARILPAKTVLGVTPAPKVAGFSSRGPIPYLGGQWLKPDIAAPGVDILAAGIKDEYYAFMSGTSMACPHISGIGALLKALHPNWSPAAIRSAMMTTATTLDNLQNMMTAEETSSAATPLDYGAGLIQPETAMHPGLVYDAGPDDYFRFLCARGYTTDQMHLFVSVPFTCPPQCRIEDLNLPSFTTVYDPVMITSKQPVIFRRVVTSVASNSSTYYVSVDHPPGFVVSVNTSYITVLPEDRMRGFEVTVTPLEATNLRAAYGSLIWSDGHHVVRSPMVIFNSAYM